MDDFETDSVSFIIFDAIREGLWPFKYRDIFLYVDSNFITDQCTVCAEVWLQGANQPIRREVVVSKRLLMIDFKVGSREVAYKMFLAFRNSTFDPVPLNIRLGEN